MVKHLYAKDRKAANQFPLRAAGMRVLGCFCVGSHDVQMSSTALERIRDMIVLRCGAVQCGANRAMAAQSVAS
jgi:hypothetical protein